MMRRVAFWKVIAAVIIAAVLATALDRARAEGPVVRFGETVPRDVREMYDRGLQYLTSLRLNASSGRGTHSMEGPGVSGLILMAYLASGEDPNHGSYAVPIAETLRGIIAAQDPASGYLGPSMYHHGFAMLALAEAYGAVDDRNLWASQSEAKPRSIGQALELAVRAAIASQAKNPAGAWRYAPDSTDADTSVSGAVLVGLLAARNAGIDVPDTAIEKGVTYYRNMTSPSGQVAYAGGMGGFDESLARISIGNLVFALARRTDLDLHKSTTRYLTERLEQSTSQWQEYTLYYQAQALFQSDVAAWEKWNRSLVRQLKNNQNPDGSFNGQFGPQLGTPMCLLALALNYCFLPIYER